jgi:hypothetical protein
MEEMKQGTALPTEGATKEEAQTMNSKDVSKPTERAISETERMESTRYEHNRLKTIKEVRSKGICGQTASALRALEALQLFWSAYSDACVYDEGGWERDDCEDRAFDRFQKEIGELYDELEGKVLKKISESIRVNMCDKEI